MYHGKEGQAWADTLATAQESKDRALANKLFAILDAHLAEEQAEDLHYSAEDVDSAYDSGDSGGYERGRYDGRQEGRQSTVNEIVDFLNGRIAISPQHAALTLMSVRTEVLRLAHRDENSQAA